MQEVTWVEVGSQPAGCTLLCANHHLGKGFVIIHKGVRSTVRGVELFTYEMPS